MQTRDRHSDITSSSPMSSLACLRRPSHNAPSALSVCVVREGSSQSSEPQPQQLAKTYLKKPKNRRAHQNVLYISAPKSRDFLRFVSCDSRRGLNIAALSSYL